VDHSFFVALTHANGVVSHLHGSKLQAAEPRRFRVTGSAGTYTVNGLDAQEEALLAGRSPNSEGERWGAEEPGNWGWLQQGDQRDQVRSEQGSWPQYYLQLQAALEAGTPPPVTLDQVLLTVRTLDAARASAEGGCVVNLGDHAT
jgi:predicted dehydrogenase